VLAAATPKTVGSTATIRIYGPIDSWGGWWGTSAKEVAQALDDLDASIDTVQVRLNSPGGDAFEGVAIMNLLRAHKAHTIAVVDGLAASAASIIATGADELVMSPGSELMIHDASTFTYGDAAEMSKAQRMLDSVSNTIASVYAAKAGGTTAAWRKLMVAETWYSADEAVSAGLADRSDTVPDIGPTETAGSDPAVMDPTDVENAFDLSRFQYAGRSHAPDPVAPAADARHPKPPTESSGGSIHTTQEGSTAVAFSDEQLTTMRQELGLPEDADEATIVSAMSEALAERAEETTSNSTQVPPGMTLVEADVLQGLQDQASLGATARQQQLDELRDRTITSAIADGRVTPARRDHWVQAWAADPEGTATLLTSLPAGLVPVAERGHDQQSTVAASAYDDLYGNQQKGA
jgi:ATP-dependent protease ClpP protease subunit